MKKRMYRICALGLVLITLVTGCNNNKVYKIKKNDEIAYSPDTEMINNYYDIDLYRYNKVEPLNESYELEKRGTEDYAEVLTETENMYEAFITLPVGNTMYDDTIYEYMLLIRNDKDYIKLIDYNTNPDKSYIKKIGSNIKSSVEKNSNLKEVYDAFVKERKLNVSTYTPDSYEKEHLGLNMIYTATNSYIVTITGEKGDVETIEIETVPLGNEQEKVYLTGKNKNKKSIWKLDLGTSPVGVSDEYYYFKGDKYLYLSINGIVEAREIQTGKKVWDTEMQIGWDVDRIVESNKIIFIFTSTGGKENLYMFDINNGKGIYPTDKPIDEYIASERYKDDYYDLKYDTAKIEGDYLIVDVTDDNNPSNVCENKNSCKEELMGYLKININTCEVKFEKVK